MEKQASWRARLSAPLVILLFFIFFFRSAFFGGRFYLAGDPLLYSYPLRTIAWEMIRAGSLPLWTPHLFAGYPLLSMAQLALAYPLTWGYLILPGHWAEQLYVLAPYLLAPLWTYAYAREVGRSREAALLSGLSFGYGGMMLSLIGLNGMLSNAVMWLPLMLIALERAQRRPFARCLAAASSAYAMSVLTGIGQGFVYVGMLALAYAIFLAALSRHSWRAWERWRPLATAICALAIAGGIGAFQILETRQAVALSVRAQLSYETFTYGSFSLPLLWRSLIEPLHNAGDASSFVPVLALLLAIAGAVAGFSRRDARAIFWFAAALVAAVLMLGAFTPLYPWLYHVPVLNRFRIPSRHAFEWTFALSMLAAWGWDAVRARAKPGGGNGTLALGTLALVIGALVGWSWWRALGGVSPGPPLSFGQTHISYLVWKAAASLPVLFAVWAGMSLAAPGWRFALLAGAIALGCFIEPFIELSHLATPFSFRASRFTYVPPATRFLAQQEPQSNRVYSQIDLAAEAHARRPRLQPLNLTALTGQQDIAGYEPLLFERYSRALNSDRWDEVNRGNGLLADPELFAPRSRVLDLLNVTYVAAYSGLSPHPARPFALDLTRWPERWEVAYEADGVVIVRNKRAQPRAWLVGEVEAVDEVEAWRRIRGIGDREFDPQRTALLETKELPVVAGRALSSDARARVTTSEPGRIVIETGAEAPALLITSEIDYPGWEARIDGQPSPILTTNYLLRGVALPAGAHRVEMIYAAPAARRGAIISLASLLTLLVIVFRAKKKGR